MSSNQTPYHIFLLSLIAVVSICVIETAAIFHGLNGISLTASISTIAGITAGVAGWAIGKKRKAEQ